MAKYIAVLRGINVGGKNKLKMEALRDMMTDLKFKNVSTYIQSGNLAFTTIKADQKKIAVKIEKAILKKFDLTVPVLVKNQEQIKCILENGPYNDNSHAKGIFFTLLEEKAEQENIDQIVNMDFGDDVFTIDNQNGVVYIYCPSSYHKTKISNNFFEKKLKVKATTRNLNTMRKLLEMLN